METVIFNGEVAMGVKAFLGDKTVTLNNLPRHLGNPMLTEK